MSKKNRVIATVTIHLTEDGAYKVGVAHGLDWKHMQGLNWSQVQIALNEIRMPALVLRSEGDRHLGSIRCAHEPEWPTGEEMAKRLAGILPESDKARRLRIQRLRRGNPIERSLAAFLLWWRPVCLAGVIDA